MPNGENYNCNPKLKKMLEQLNAEAELEDAMINASTDMKVGEKLAGATRREIEFFFAGWNDALTERETRNQNIHEKYHALYQNHPEFFLAENATKRERAEYWRLHNI